MVAGYSYPGTRLEMSAGKKLGAVTVTVRFFWVCVFYRLRTKLDCDLIHVVLVKGAEITSGVGRAVS